MRARSGSRASIRRGASEREPIFVRSAGDDGVFLRGCPCFLPRHDEGFRRGSEKWKRGRRSVGG